MKVWMAPMLVVLYWLPWMLPEEAPWDGSAFDLYMFESPDRVALAVVSPDPFAVDSAARGWRAEIHVRTGDASVTGELFFETDTIQPDTVVFVETAWGREVHVFTSGGTQTLEETPRRRWRVEEEGLRELEMEGRLH
jgi:hypothetical protein